MDIPRDQPIVIFDGVCNFCDRTVRFLMDRDRAGRFRFASNQSEAGSALLREHAVDPGKVDSVFLVEGDRIWTKSAAALEITRRMPSAWKLLYGFVVVPRPIRDWFYDLFARNRYRMFGRSESCRLPTEAERSRFLA